MNDLIKELEKCGWSFGEVYGYAAITFKSPRMKYNYITEKSPSTIEEWKTEERIALIEEKKNYLNDYFNILGADIIKNYEKLIDNNVPLGDMVKMTVDIIL